MRTEGQSTGQSEDRTEQVRQRKIVLGTAAVAGILVAAIVGLTLGKGAAPEDEAPVPTTKEAFINARTSTAKEARGDSARDGYITGRKSGARQGGRAGRRAGKSDGALQAQLEITSAAQSAAAAAQSALDSIATPPPAPKAPPAGTKPPDQADQ